MALLYNPRPFNYRKFDFFLLVFLAEVGSAYLSQNGYRMHQIGKEEDSKQTNNKAKDAN